jgi:hypothetical protein
MKREVKKVPKEPFDFWKSVANTQAKLQAYQMELDTRPETDKLEKEGVVGILMVVALIVIAGIIIWRVVF